MKTETAGIIVFPLLVRSLHYLSGGKRVLINMKDCHGSLTARVVIASIHSHHVSRYVDTGKQLDALCCMTNQNELIRLSMVSFLNKSTGREDISSIQCLTAYSNTKLLLACSLSLYFLCLIRSHHALSITYLSSEFRCCSNHNSSDALSVHRHQYDLNNFMLVSHIVGPLVCPDAYLRVFIGSS